MRFVRALSCCSAVLICAGSLSAHAVVSTAWRTPASALRVHKAGVVPEVSASLREDVARHPNDFVTFETLTAGNRFLEEHWVDASRETEQRMIDRGVLGYWRGKTLVLLPILSMGQTTNQTEIYR